MKSIEFMRLCESTQAASTQEELMNRMSVLWFLRNMPQFNYTVFTPAELEAGLRHG